MDFLLRDFFHFPLNFDLLAPLCFNVVKLKENNPIVGWWDCWLEKLPVGIWAEKEAEIALIYFGTVEDYDLNKHLFLLKFSY